MVAVVAVVVGVGVLEVTVVPGGAILVVMRYSPLYVFQFDFVSAFEVGVHLLLKGQWNLFKVFFFLAV